MSQVPTDVASEPRTGEAPQAPAQAGTAGPAAGTQEPPSPQHDWKTDAEHWKAEADRLKGFQRLYTQAKQSRVWDAVEESLRGATPEQAAERLARTQKAVSVLDEIEKMGGWDRVKADWALFNDALSEAPAATPPGTPPAASANAIPREELDAMVRSVVDKALSQALERIDTAGLKEEAVHDLVKKYGLAKGDGKPDPSVLRMVQGALDSDLGDLTAGVRDPLPEEIEAAASRVGRALFDPLRASGAALTTPQPSEPTPPAMNARVLGGQVPAKPPSQMTPEEAREAALATARAILSESLANAPPPPQLPNDGLHSFV